MHNNSMNALVQGFLTIAEVRGDDAAVEFLAAAIQAMEANNRKVFVTALAENPAALSIANRVNRIRVGV